MTKGPYVWLALECYKKKPFHVDAVYDAYRTNEDLKKLEFFKDYNDFLN